ncbi:MAG: outer membrane protein assembly factor BamE [Blastochloris sp.]|nr:outer membrane protein assembly factor BamE [Blastochloris sp.]
MKKILKMSGSLLLMLVLCLSLVACGSKLNAENFSKIKTGMSEQEVRQILGKPSKVEEAEVLGLQAKTFIYENKPEPVKVSFINNSVSSKHGSF